MSLAGTSPTERGTTWQSLYTPSRISGIPRHKPLSACPRGRLRKLWRNGRNTSNSIRTLQQKEARHLHRLGSRLHNRLHNRGSASGMTSIPSSHWPAYPHSTWHRGRTHVGNPSRFWHILVSWNQSLFLPLGPNWRAHPLRL